MILEDLGVVAYRTIAVSEVGQGNMGGPPANLEFFADWFWDMEGEGITLEAWYDLGSAFSFEGGSGLYSSSTRCIEGVRQDWCTCNGYCKSWIKGEVENKN